MLCLIEALKETINQSTANEFREFINQYPKGLSWYIISDYCLEDPGKVSDVMTFSTLLNHDKIETIKKNVSTWSPKDIKKTRTVDPTFISYINSSVFYHFSFIFRKEDNFLTKIILKEEMNDILEFILNYADQQIQISPDQIQYWNSVKRRSLMFLQEMKNKNFNLKLARKVFITGTLAGVILYYIHLFNHAEHVAWISDRDAVIDRYDGIIYDIAFILFSITYSQDLISPTKEERIKIPTFHCTIPEKSGNNFMDEFIRIPDYLAGTIALYSRKKGMNINNRYTQVLGYSVIDSENHSLIEIIDENDGKTLYTRRLRLRS